MCSIKVVDKRTHRHVEWQ